MFLRIIYFYVALDALQYGIRTEPFWKKAQKQFEYLLQPAEERVAVKLKKQLSNVNANTRQVRKLNFKHILINWQSFSYYMNLVGTPN